jgi:hypothetical protein
MHQQLRPQPCRRGMRNHFRAAQASTADMHMKQTDTSAMLLYTAVTVMKQKFDQIKGS